MRLTNIQIFIDSGFRTIPYQKIFYNSEGKKETSPAVRWSEYLNQMNTTPSPAGAVICDSVLVVDCDNLEATNQFLKILDIPEVQTHEDLVKPDLYEYFGLVVKTSRGYHFYFENDGSYKDGKADKIDILATNKKICYLPTEASEGKEIVVVNLAFQGGMKILLYPPSPQLSKWIKDINETAKAPENQILKPNQTKPIRPIGTPLAKIPKGTTLFYRRLTPKRFRDMPKYRVIYEKKGFLEPDDIQHGDGNDYLVAVAGILCCEISIDPALFWDIMGFINSQWSEPLSSDALAKKVSGYAENRYPECPFLYDSLWENYQCSFIDIDGNDIIMVYDLKTSKYIVTNLTNWETYTKNQHDAVSFYCNRTRLKMTGSALAATTLGVNTIFNPTKPFGLQEGNIYNTYKHSKFLDILNGEGTYTAEEIEQSKNNKVVPFLEHLFRAQKSYFLRFLKTKLTTFGYSPTTFYLFDEEGGAGKGVLESLLGRFVGESKVTNIPYETFKSKFTSEFEGRLFLFLNEYPAEFQAKQAITDKIKDITGSPRVKIEKKGCDPYEVINFFTLFISSNRVSIEIKEGDRRFYVVQCCEKYVNVFNSSYYDEMTSDEELTKFAIFLRHCVSSLDQADYMNPPFSDAKALFIDVNESEVDKCVRKMLSQKYADLTEYHPDCLVFTGKESLINLTLISESLNIHGRILSNEIKKKFGSKNVKPSIISDNNRKYNPSRCCTFLVLEPEALKGVIPQIPSKNRVI